MCIIRKTENSALLAGTKQISVNTSDLRVGMYACAEAAVLLITLADGLNVFVPESAKFLKDLDGSPILPPGTLGKTDAPKSMVVSCALFSVVWIEVKFKIISKLFSVVSCRPTQEAGPGDQGLPRAVGQDSVPLHPTARSPVSNFVPTLVLLKGSDAELVTPSCCRQS